MIQHRSMMITILVRIAVKIKYHMIGSKMNKRYVPWNPEWFYSRFRIDNLEQIQKEFLIVKDVKWKEYIGVDTNNSTWWDFALMPKHAVEEFLPTLVDWLTHIGLYDRWITVAFSTVNHSEHPMRIHVDSTAVDQRRISVNIPVLNCEKTYTVWYDAELDYDNVLPEVISPEVEAKLHTRLKYDPAIKYSHWGIESTAVEIKRLETNQPVIVNITIPHRPVSDHNQTRILACLRFTPELTDADLKKLGVDTPFVQV